VLLQVPRRPAHGSVYPVFTQSRRGHHLCQRVRRSDMDRGTGRLHR
jgi:hypothetical protein